jgi:HlyD family secretion protein
MTVRQEQKLFFLPDLSEMEVQVVVNESIVNRVHPGLTAIVEFEAIPELRITGKLLSISEIPNRENQRGEDVRYFFGEVKLEHSAPGLKPGMTAVVTFMMPGREDVLAVPYEAIISEQGSDACFIAAGDHLERREVKLGKATPDLVEITEGLTEGDDVVLNPPGRISRPRSLAGFEEYAWPEGLGARAAEPKPASPRAKGAFEGDGPSRKGSGPLGASGRRPRKGAPDAE